MKATTSGAASVSQQALIFIPDISGFTQFVTDTEISHSKHIIEELLEILIDSNKIGLEISEIEGDAILFYRFGDAPTVDEMLWQVREMFSRFHMHLKKYERHRICNCGACCTAHKLAIKFISHYGHITINNIKQYKKLFGKEVIVAHRLLKNEIDSHEYSLFTNDLLGESETWKDIDQKAWSPVNHAEQEYDSGKVQYCYVSLIPLLDTLPEPTIEDYSIQGMKSKVFESQTVIEAPMETVVNVVMDIHWRSKWLPGVLEEITDVNSTLTQVGQTHKCLAKGPVITSHDYNFTDQLITFTETADKKNYCVVYTLKRLDDHRTQINTNTFIKKNFFMELMFKIMMKSKMGKLYDQAWSNLNKYCTSLTENGVNHPYSIQQMPGRVGTAFE